MQAECARLVGRRGRDAAADVAAQGREAAHGRAGDGIDHLLGLVPAAATDDDRAALELRVAQELDGRIERVHVQVRDQARGVGHCEQCERT
jgi:hypothetical protein